MTTEEMTENELDERYETNIDRMIKERCDGN